MVFGDISQFIDEIRNRLRNTPYLWISLVFAIFLWRGSKRNTELVHELSALFLWNKFETLVKPFQWNFETSCREFSSLNNRVIVLNEYNLSRNTLKNVSINRIGQTYNLIIPSNKNVKNVNEVLAHKSAVNGMTDAFSWDH